MAQMIMSVFTEKYNKIQNRLMNSAVIETTDGILPVIAQWDTGATGTCISKEVVEKLNLKPTGMVQVRTPSGIGVMNKYIVNLILNNEVRIQNLIVMDSEIGNQGIDVLVGMDIITLGDFAVSNFEGKTQFSFRIPSQEFDVKKYERSLREEGREEGLEEGLELGEEKGLELGEEKGRDLKLIQQVYKKYAKNHSVEEASGMLEEDSETIQKIYDAIKSAGTDDAEEIYRQYVKTR